MKVIYRVCDIESTNPPPIFKNDRVGLNKRCLDSFIKAFDGCDIEVYFLCDNTGDYDHLLELPFTKSVDYSNNGINYTYLRSLELGRELNDDVFFLECDYLFMPGAGKEIIAAIDNFDFISPYDHPDKYPGVTYMDIFNNRHWRTAVSTTMTFATKKDNLIKHFDLLTKHGYLDHQMWVELQETTGKNLWTPIPGLATHMVEKYLSPNILITEYC